MTAPGKLIKDTGSRTKNKAQETHKIRQEVIQQDSAVRQTGLGPKCRALETRNELKSTALLLEVHRKTNPKTATGQELDS